MEQTIDAAGDFLTGSDEGTDERRWLVRYAKAGDADEGFGEWDGAAGILRDGDGIRRPFGKTSPGAVEGTEKRDDHERLCEKPKDTPPSEVR